MSVLPFSDEATITDRAGAVLASVKVRVWPTSSSSESVGQAYDYRGVAEAPAREPLDEAQNRELRITGGDTYRVVSATWNPIIGYVAMALRRVRPDG